MGCRSFETGGLWRNMLWFMAFSFTKSGGAAPAACSLCKARRRGRAAHIGTTVWAAESFHGLKNVNSCASLAPAPLWACVCYGACEAGFTRRQSALLKIHNALLNRRTSTLVWLVVCCERGGLRRRRRIKNLRTTDKEAIAHRDRAR